MRAPAPTCWMRPDVRVAPSKIAGRGLFATTDLPAGTAVCRVGGRLVSTAELSVLIRTSAEYVDTIVVDDDLHLLVTPGSANHFGNHSCDPTLGWTDEYTLATLRDVGEGEELTSDYATSTDDPDFVLYCHCETFRCRQVIEGSDWRIPQLRKRYAGHWVPYLQRRIDASGG
jgi:hypothetical protein